MIKYKIYSNCAITTLYFIMGSKMSLQSQKIDHLVQLFSKQKCRQIDDISNSIGYSVISVRRFLKQIGYFRSYTHNGKWYTLQSIPAFNKNGLWHFNDIGFSKHGNLTQTIFFLVNRSRKGLTAKELSQLLKTPCHAVLTNMHKNTQLDRDKYTQEFVYLSTDRRINRRQRKFIETTLDRDLPQLLSAETSVFVLVEFIKDSTLSFEQITANLKNKMNIIVAAEDIAQLFENHGIKKSPDVSHLKR